MADIATLRLSFLIHNQHVFFYHLEFCDVTSRFCTLPNLLLKNDFCEKFCSNFFVYLLKTNMIMVVLYKYTIKFNKL